MAPERFLNPRRRPPQRPRFTPHMNNTLVKGLAILELVSRSDRPLNLTEISQRLGLVKSNVHRLLQGLVEQQVVRRDEKDGTYAPAIKLWELGAAALAKFDLRLYAEGAMDELAAQTGENVHLSVLDGRDVVYIHRVDCPHPIRAFAQVGSRAPAHCVATGKAQLAFGRKSLVDEIAASLVRYTEHTLSEPQAFLSEIGKVRRQGFAINRGEWREGVCGVAAPILGPHGAVVGGVSVGGPAMRFRRERMQEWAQAVVAAASRISHELDASPTVGSALARLRFGA